MEAGNLSDSEARTERAVAERPSLSVVAKPVASQDPGVAGGIVRFSLSSSTQSGEIDCAGGIVRFGFGSHGH